MNGNVVWDKLTAILNETFDTELTLSRATTAADVDGWDSLTHIQLLAAVEKAFGIRFNIGEMNALKNVGDLADLISRRVSAAPVR